MEFLCSGAYCNFGLPRMFGAFSESKSEARCVHSCNRDGLILYRTSIAASELNGTAVLFVGSKVRDSAVVRCCSLLRFPGIELPYRVNSARMATAFAATSSMPARQNRIGIRPRGCQVETFNLAATAVSDSEVPCAGLFDCRLLVCSLHVMTSSNC